MNIVDNEVIVCFDCDDTLVMWDSNHNYQDFPGTPELQQKIPFINPYDNSIAYLKPHKRHIELLKQYKGRGFYVRVWSAGGVQWAKAVVETLGLEQYVDSVETKPAKYVDDLQAADVLGVRIYIKDE